MPFQKIQYQILREDQLSQTEPDLLESAVRAFQFSHSPYSRHKVSCAVLLSDGQIVTGANQENASYPAGLCAERVALFTSKNLSEVPIKSILVIARNEKNKPADAFSCGGCRQVMLEYASLQSEKISILMGNKRGDFIKIEDVKELMPFHFSSDSIS